MLSKRANVFYLEFCRIQKQDERVVYLTQTGRDIESFFNIPEKNTAFIMLGKGTSITQPAVRKLAESQVIVGFCGSGGSPSFGSIDVAFLNMESEYRPTQYMQSWAKMWFDEEQRLKMARHFINKRIELVTERWLKDFKISIPADIINRLYYDMDNSINVNQMLLSEAKWAKSLYGILARHFSVRGFSRRKKGDEDEGTISHINDLLDQGNYLGYGYAATSLSGMGISYMFPILHGKTRRGALVFDLADIFKDAIIMPLAFQLGSQRKSNKEFREALIEKCFDFKLLDLLFNFIKDAVDIIDKNQQVKVLHAE